MDNPEPCAPEVLDNPLSLGALEGAREKMSLGLTPRIIIFMDAMDEIPNFALCFACEEA